MLKLIDDLSPSIMRQLYEDIRRNPVKSARRFFPERPGNYVKTTKLIGAYFINRYTALELARRNNNAYKTYAKICAEIWCEIPSFGKSINL